MTLAPPIHPPNCAIPIIQHCFPPGAGNGKQRSRDTGSHRYLPSMGLYLSQEPVLINTVLADEKSRSDKTALHLKISDHLF